MDEPELLCAAAVSTAMTSKDAVAEVRANLTAQIGDRHVDLMLVFATPHHVEEIDHVMSELRDACHPACLVGCTADSLIGDDKEIEGATALSVFVLCAPGARIEPFEVRFDPDAGEPFAGFPFERLAENSSESGVVILGDPYSLPMDGLLSVINERLPGVPVSGGMASGGALPGINRLFLNDRVLDEGAVGFVIDGEISVRSVTSQGCRPVGNHYVITRGQRNLIQELGGRPAVQRLHELLDGLGEHDRSLLRGALHIGRAINVYQSRFSRGDFLVRSVLGIDQGTGALAINDSIRPGQTVQFHVRDPESAGQDLDLLIQEETPFFGRNRPVGALLFSCNGRGIRMFGEPNHDVGRVTRHLGVPVAGFFAAGEIGPVGGQNFLHGFTASVLVFCRRSGGEPSNSD